MSASMNQTELLELQSWQEAIIPLEPEHFDRASQISQCASYEAQQWQTYLNGLALWGFVNWLGDRAAELPVQPDQCSIFQPPAVSGLNVVCNLLVGEFRLCLIVTESVAHEVVTVPRAVVELPELAAHFYVLLEVQEEQMQMILRGCLRHDHLRHQRQFSQSALTDRRDRTDLFPLHWFDPDSNHLLFDLRFLEPAAFALPAVSAPLLRPPTPAPPTPALINVWNWTQNLLDATVQALSWTMPQPLIPAGAMRRSAGKIEAALQDLIQRQEFDMPQQVQYAYTTLEDTAFQLAAVTWLLSRDRLVPEWALLLILVAQPGKMLPVGTTLQVSTTTVLAEVTLDTTDLYLYVLVEGNQDEAFTPTILPPNAAAIVLPTFICHPPISSQGAQ